MKGFVGAYWLRNSQVMCVLKAVMAAHTASLELSEAASINVQVVIRSDCDGRE